MYLPKLTRVEEDIFATSMLLLLKARLGASVIRDTEREEGGRDRLSVMRLSLASMCPIHKIDFQRAICPSFSDTTITVMQVAGHNCKWMVGELVLEKDPKWKCRVA